MAVDEAILQAVGQADAPPTLRMYRWREPTLSLGYGQPCGDVASAAGEVHFLPLVRRSTGGGAIVHADELTYSLVVPTSDAGACPAEMYRRVNAAIIAAVESLTGRRGLVREHAGNGDADPRQSRKFFCFERRSPHDLMAGADKLAGAAQRRTGRAMLQHGSVILRRTFPAQASASLAEVAGREIGFEEAAEAIARAFRDAGTALQPGALAQVERDAVGPLEGKHASEQWIRRR